MLRRLHTKVSHVWLLAFTGAIAACSSGGGSPATSTTNQVVADHPSWATPKSLTGEVPADQSISIQVHLQMRDAAGAAARLTDISNPDSANYGKFVSDDEYNATYAPTDDDVAAVRAHLESNGLKVVHVPANHTFILATGTAAQIDLAFSTRLGLYRVDSQTRRAPIDPPTVPAAIAPKILGVLGLSEDLQMKPKAVHTGGIRHDALKTPYALPPRAIGGNGECSEWYGETPDYYDPPYGSTPLTLAPCGYSPAQIREAYGFEPSIRKGNDGTGVSIAVVDAWLSPTLASDAETFAAQNDPDYPLAPSQLTIVQAPGIAQPPITDWYTEQALDVEAVHSIAPGASIVAVVAQSQSDQDLVAAVNTIIEQKLATIVSNSYELQEETALTDAVIWEAVATQAGLKGIGLYFSSGDSGDDAPYAGAPSLEFPGSLPTVTSVGGTSLAMGSTGQKLWETGWSDGYSQLYYNAPPPPDEDGGTGEEDGGGFSDDGGGFSDDAGVGSADASLPPAVDAGTSTPSARLRGRVPLDSTDGGGGDAGGVVYGLQWYPGPPGFFAYGGGGGVSILSAQPSYQKGIVPVALANRPGAPARVIPDVSMVGDPTTGFVIGESYSYGTYTEYAVGGTSLSSPLFAGVMALAQQNAKKTFGFANALLYKASKKGAFNDVLPLSTPQAVSEPEYGYVISFDYELQSIHTTAGFDDITGLGTPNGATFLSSTK